MYNLWEERPEADARLTELWKRGDSTTKIAEIMQSEFGVPLSRNAVIGRVHRLDLTRRRKKRAKPKPKPKPKSYLPVVSAPMAIAAPVASPLPSEPVYLLDLPDNRCHYPLGDSFYCGQRNKSGSSYCRYHHVIMHKPKI